MDIKIASRQDNSTLSSLRRAGDMTGASQKKRLENIWEDIYDPAG